MSERRSAVRSECDATVSNAPGVAAPNAAQSDSERLAPGSVIDGRFEVEGVLGSGGMGYVLRARHRELDERVAIKLLLPSKADDAARERMLREAQNAAKIKSEHSVRVFDVVTTGPYAPYILMELLEGESLAARLSRSGPLPIGDAVDVVLQASEAVGEAHRLRIVHRDLKPSNLFLVDRPGRGALVKVLDFGVSKRFEMDSAELTHSRALLGSPVYAPPEQLRASHRVDGRADIWALGVILYQASTGTLPFVGDTLAEVCTRILQEAPARPRVLRPELPSSLELTILRCLEKKPERRFGSIEEFVVSLRPLAPATATRTLIYLDAVRAAVSPAPEPEQAPDADAEGALGFSTKTLAEQSVVRPKRRGARALALVAVLGAMAALGLGVVAGIRLRISSATRVASGASRESLPAAPVPATAVPGLALGVTEARSAPAASSASPPGASPSAESSAAPPVRAPKPVRRHSTGEKRPARSGSAETHPWVDSR